MKKLAIALALALTLTGTLTACSRRDTMRDSYPMNGSSMTGQVSQRSQVSHTGKAWDYLDDARYTAGANGRVYGGDGNTFTRDLTQGARDIVRGTENAAKDVGRGLENAARDAGDAAKDLGKDMTGQAKTY